MSTSTPATYRCFATGSLSRRTWPDTVLSFHKWCYLALHRLEFGDISAALVVYDRVVHPKSSAIALELVDASQFLARIALRGGNVGARWHLRWEWLLGANLRGRAHGSEAVEPLQMEADRACAGSAGHAE